MKEAGASCHAHIVEIDEQNRLLTIYRLTGKKRVLFTSVELPSGTWKGNAKAMKQFCQTLGENLILDSPHARKILGI
jgi:hypothetical protein